MIYKFKSKATGDLIMLGPQGDLLLRILGREPAARGIIEVDAMPAALAALEAAIARADAPKEATAQEETNRQAEPEVGLRQRLWPMVEMLRQAHAASQAVVWGV